MQDFINYEGPEPPPIPPSSTAEAIACLALVPVLLGIVAFASVLWICVGATDKIRK